MPRDPRSKSRVPAPRLSWMRSRRFSSSSETIRYYDYNKAYQSLLMPAPCNRAV